MVIGSLHQVIYEEILFPILYVSGQNVTDFDVSVVILIDHHSDFVDSRFHLSLSERVFKVVSKRLQSELRLPFILVYMTTEYKLPQ